MGFPRDTAAALDLAGCPGCDQPPRPAAMVLCHHCETAQHFECWQRRPGCAAPGCSSRSFSASPVDTAGALEFYFRQPLGLRQVLPPYLTLSASFYLAVVFFVAVGAPEAHLSMLALLFCAYIVGFLGICMGPDAFEVRYRVEAGRGLVRTRYLGPFALPILRQWQASDLAELTVRPVHRALPDGGDEIRRVELWLRDTAGRELLLETLPWRARADLLCRVKAAAEQLDLVVQLPTELAYPRGLPPGVADLVHSLPEVPEGPEVSEVPEVSEGSEAVVPPAAPPEGGP